MSAVRFEELRRRVAERPGVYRMFGGDGELLYVGKARNLRDRVSHLFQPRQGEPKTFAMVQQIAHIEVTATVGNRSAAARIQPDQASPSALQRHAAR